jgi:flagellar biosynthesis chaperone FliJ
MSLSNDQKHQLNKLIDYRDSISSSLFQIERILKQYFPEEFDLAYQHYIPQISTALHDEQKWLSRGGYSMQDTINKLLDKSNDDKVSGVNKYI